MKNDFINKNQEGDFTSKSDEVIVNTSLAYLPPMLWYSHNQIINLKGCFMGDSSKPDLINHIFILINYESKESFIDYEQMLMSHKNFIDRYDPDKYTVMYVYSVPEEYQKEYNTFKDSKYSRFSDTFKRRVVQYWELLANAKYFKVMYRDQGMRKALENWLSNEHSIIELSPEAEVLSALDSEIEVYSSKFIAPKARFKSLKA